MTSQLLAVLAAGGLIATGITATSEVRSANALPVQQLALVHGAAKLGVRNCLASARKPGQKATAGCSSQLMQDAAGGAVGAGLGGSTGGVVVGGLVVAGSIGLGVVVANATSG